MYSLISEVISCKRSIFRHGRKFLAYLQSLFAMMGLSMISNAQVTAYFSTSFLSTPCTPAAAIACTNESTGASTITWTLNGAFVSSSTISYSGTLASAGTYTIALTASNGTTSATFDTVIQVYSKPIPAFTSTPSSICPGFPVTFTNTSSASGAPGPLTYNWTFNDGTTDPSTNPVHHFASPGTYAVALEVTSSAGCDTTLFVAGCVHVDTPAVPFFNSPDTFFCRPSTATFINGSTGFNPLTYAWRFGDGHSSTATNPVHTYSSTGFFPVSLVVTDGHSCVDSFDRASYINISSGSAQFVPITTACVFSSDTFYNTSTTHISATWYFGDGTSQVAENGVHNYSAAGTYPVMLVIYTGSCFDTITHNITITALPTGSFSISPRVPCLPPGDVTFTAAVPPGSSVSWLFGDDTSRSGTVVSRPYQEPVIDFTEMIITNSIGCVNTIVDIDTFYNFTPQIGGTPSAGCVPLTVDFSAPLTTSVYDALTGLYLNFGPTYYLSLPYPVPVSSYVWDFGDGSPTSGGPLPIHTFTAVGIYTVTCSMVSSNGCSYQSTDFIKVGAPPIATFVKNPSQVCADHLTTFTSIITGTADYYNWDFGDGSTGVFDDSVEVHKFTTPGVYNVTFTAFDRTCPSVSVVQADSVDSPAAIMVVNYSCSPRNQVTLSSTSLGASSVQWIFGDGSPTSALTSVTHTYPSLSTYTTKLATYNARSGCRDTASTSLILSNPGIYFYATDSAICKDVRMDTFLSTISGGLTGINYKWYDDGTLISSGLPFFFGTFHTRGTFSIMLVVTDNHNCLDTFTRTNYLTVAKPIDSFAYTPAAGCSPLPVSFTDYSTDVTGTFVSRHFWSFGNGDTSSFRGANPIENYTTAGAFLVKEIVTDNLGCKDTLNISGPTVHKPTASFTTPATTVCAGTNVHFNNTSTQIASSLWVFGDGDTSTQTSPYHVFDSGRYVVKLVVYDSLGCNSDTFSATGHINVNPEPHSSFTMNDSFAVCPPLNVQFTNTSRGEISNTWYLDNGSPPVFVTNPTASYLTPALYTILLVTKNSYGCYDTAASHASIFGYAGAFSYTPLHGCSPSTVTLSAPFSSDSVTGVIWDFGDGTSYSGSLANTITHTYVIGAYLPNLTLISPRCGTVSSPGLDSIKVDTLTAAFTDMPDPVCQGSILSFRDSSFSRYSPDTAWFWTFGTGATSSLAAPGYVYSVAGTFPVTLQVTNEYGCSRTLTQNVTVISTAGAIQGALTVCADASTPLTDTPSTGTWSSANTAVLTIGSSSGIASGVMQGTSTVTYELPSGCQNQAVVRVNTIPSAILGIANFCAGSSTTLSDTTRGGLWTSSNPTVASVGTSGIVNGVSAGTVTITYAFGSGTECGAMVVVTVNPVPASISGIPLVCNGQTITLTDVTTDGSWTTRNASVATIDPTAGTVTGVSAGTTQVTYTIGLGCRAITTVTVLPLSQITGNSAICAGFSTTFSDLTSGGTWSSSNTSVAIPGTRGGMFTGISAGTSLISYSLPTGCVSTTTLVVNPLPGLISGNPHICQGTGTTLSDTGGGTWSSTSAIVSSGSTTGIITGVSLGSAMVTYTLATGCLTTTSVYVTAYPSSVSGLSQVCVGLTTTLSDATPGGFWSSSSGFTTVGSVSGLVTGNSAGSDTISYTVNTCAVTATFTVNPLPGSIAGSGAVCTSFANTLSDTSAGGTWSSGTTGVATIGALSGILTGVTPGTVLITYTLPTGCLTTTPETVFGVPPAITGATAVCMGLSTTDSNLMTGGYWTSTNATVATVGSGSGLISGITAGTVVISYNLNGCSSMENFVVNPLPGPITGGTGCVGLTTQFSDTTIGGTWGSGSTGIATIDSGTGISTGLSAGTTVLTYTLSTGCITTLIETVLNLPHSISGPSTVCAGANVSLSDSTSGGSWSSLVPGTATVGSLSGVVTGVTAGTTVITYTVSGCPISSPIEVNPLPKPILAPDSICALGASITAADSTVGGTWSATNVAIGSTGLVTSSAAGTAIITYTLGTGCSISKTIAVSPLPRGINGPDYICIDSIVHFTDSSSGGTWNSTGFGFYATVDEYSGDVLGLSTGSAIITYALGTGCVSTKTIAVNPQLIPITGPTVVCQGSGILLRDTSYYGPGSWGSLDTSIATVGSLSGNVTGVAEGAVIITYSVTNTCGTSAVTYSVFVNPLPVPGTITGDSIVCTGSTIVLEDTTGGPGTWSTMNLKASVAGGIVTGLLSGPDTIIHIVSNICGIDTAFKPVAVDSSPVVEPIAGPSSVCVGAQVVLTNTILTGTWTSANSLATITSGVVTGVMTGTDIISYAVGNSCGTSVVMHPMTIVPLPDSGMISGDSAVCSGYSVLLTETVPGGAWSSANSLAQVDSSGNVTGVTAGRDTLFYSVTNVCRTAKTKFGITVDQTPGPVHIVTFPDSAMCANSLYQNFGADTTAPPGITYSWSAENAQIFASAANKQYCLVDFNAAGYSRIILKAGAAGTSCYSADSVLYKVGSNVSIEPGVVYYEPELVCIDNTSDGYQWGYDDVVTLDSTIFPGEINQNYYNPNLDLLDKYYWVLTSHNGCLQKSYYNAPLKVNVTVADDKITVLLYPNPADSKINIALNEANKSSDFDVKMINVAGQVVVSANFTGNRCSLPLKDCTAGVYMVYISENGTKIGTGTFIKK